MFDFLYDNIGGKIKSAAGWTFIVEAISTIITGIAMAIKNYEGGYLLISIIGPIVAWVSSWILYAFGQIVEDIHAMRNKEYPTKQKPPVIKVETELKKQPIQKTSQPFVKKEKVNSQSTPVTITKNIDIIPKKEQKEELQNMLPCPQCGEDLSFMGWNDNDLNEMQTCPLCGKEILLNQ